MLAPAREGGYLREAAVAADGECQTHLFRLDSGYSRGRRLLNFLAGNNLCLQPWEEAPSTGTTLT